MNMKSLGKYQIIRHIADGGMATIWLAEFTGPQGFTKEVVIKRMLPELENDPFQRDMFLDEARLASQLSHPNIGQIIELGEDEGAHYIAMEFIDGLSLEAILADGPLQPQIAARIMVDVLAALEHAHTAVSRNGQPLGIVHRDVTPSNVLVSNDGIVKLVDFGVAKALGNARETQAGAVKGKYAYMSPEQIQADVLTRQSDVFAAGITFYEMLSGNRPFGDDIRAVSAILREEPEALTTAPEPFAQIVFKALEKPLTSRYATARAMQLDLETVLRAQGSYVGQREIAVLVRELRGLSVTDLSTQDLDAGLFSSYRGELAAVGASAEMPIFASKAPSLKWPYAAAIIAAIGIGAVTWFVSQSGHKIPDNTTLILGESAVMEVDTFPKMLLEKSGVPVVIRTLPNSDIYHVKKKVGSTPLTTQLTPGNYTLQFRRGDQNKTFMLEIPKGTALVQKDLRLSDLEDVVDEAPSKEEAKPKTKPRAKNDFFDTFKKAMK